MKNTKRKGLAIVTIIVAFILLLLVIRFQIVDADNQPTGNGTPTSTPPLIIKDILSHRQRAWLYALMWCESKARPEAINKFDRDGTPSYGILQFKPGTFKYFMAQYNLGTSTDFMDPQLQQKIVEQMIIQKNIKWSQQFPDCSSNRKLGTPPLN